MEGSLLFGLGNLSQKEKVGGEGKVQDRGWIVQSCEQWEKSGFFLSAFSILKCLWFF